MERYLTVTEARRNLLELVQGLHAADRVIITKRGRPRAVLVDADRYAILEDLAWVLQDPGRRDALQRSWDEMRRGDRVGRTRRGVPSVRALKRELAPKRSRAAR
jgi:prevent-host-death family protein